MRGDLKPFLLGREVLFGNVRVTGARKSVGGHRLFEGVNDGWAIQRDATELLRPEVQPRSQRDTTT
jgi:hypothetical protein